MINEMQIRAARALIDWSQGDLAEKSGLALATIKRMEKLGPGRSSADNVQAVHAALEEAGVEFLNHGNPGVRLRDFRAGDRVRLRKGTMVWGQHHELKDVAGLVRTLVNDGTSMKRITVAYDGIDMFVGMDANMFEFAR